MKHNSLINIIIGITIMQRINKRKSTLLCNDNYWFNNVNYCAYVTVIIISSIIWIIVHVTIISSIKLILYNSHFISSIILTLCNVVCRCKIPYATILLSLDILAVKSDNNVDHFYLKMLLLSFFVHPTIFCYGVHP